MHYIHSAVSPLADSFPAKKQPSLFTALQPLAHDGAEPDPIKPVMNGYNAAPYRTSTAFNAFTNNSRARQQPQPPASAGPFRDPFSQPYPTAADVFGPAPLPGQQPQHLAHPDAISPSRMYEYDQALTTLPSAKSHFGGIVQESRFGPSSSLLQSQQVQISKSQQQQHAAPAQASQQGPYLPAPNSNYSMPNGITAPPPQPQFPAHQPPAQANGQNLQPAGQNASGEEISTIFVVGFPEDMQEREFQNMFTFCSGFEAATLKIPNKDSNAYGTNNNAPQGPAARPNGFGPSGYPPPQIGYAGDGFGTEQGVVAWPPSGHDEHFGRPQEPQQAIQAPTVPPRKQIIGFAKFKTRAEALEARDVLQGKRIDIEKGAVLKAEMAKKNLHTKRGVGPLGIPMALVGTGATVAPDTLAGLGAINGLPAGIGASEALTQRERELGAIGAMGLAGVASRSRDRPDDVEEKLRRATLAGPVVAVAFVRRDQDDKERRQRESDAAKMRGYDAFYSVPAQHRPTGGSIAQPAENSGMSGYPFPASASGTAAVQPFSSHDLFAPAGTAGTWGHGATKTDRFGTSRAVGTIGPPRPPSDPQSSPPPAETSTSSASTIGSATITAADAMSPKPLSPTQASSQLPPLMLPMASRAYSPTSGEAVAGGDVRSMPASSGSSVTGSQGSENGEMGRSVTSGGTPNDAMSPQQPASPVSGGSSVTTNANMRPNVTDQNPPINTLYVGNLPTSPPPGYPPNQLEESLRILFQRCPGFRKLCFRQKSNGPMCFVEFDDVQFASRAMQDLYGDTLNGLVKNGIRLSYSKNPLGVRTQPTGPTPNARQEPPHTGPIGIQEAFNGRHLQSPTSLTMPIEIGHSRPRAEEVPGMYNNFAASPPSRFFPSPPPGPHARPAFSPLMAQQTQYARPSTQHVYAPAPVSGFNFGPGALSPASPPPVWMPPSAPNDSIDDRYMSPGDFGTHAMSPSPGLEVSRAA